MGKFFGNNNKTFSIGESFQKQGKFIELQFYFSVCAQECPEGYQPLTNYFGEAVENACRKNSEYCWICDDEGIPDVHNLRDRTGPCPKETFSNANLGICHF